MFENFHNIESTIVDFDVRASRSSKKEWDVFAIRCGCSYRCAYAAAWALNAGSATAWRIWRYDIYDSKRHEAEKIGQCAIVAGPSIRIFADQLQLLPAADPFWAAAMHAVLKTAGPGTYRYGSEWTTERPRGSDLALLPGSDVVSVRQAFLETVELYRWASWEDYWNAISSNARRNFRKGEGERSGLRLQTLSGLDVIRALPATIRLRSSTLHQKLSNGYPMSLMLKTLLRTLVLLDRTWVMMCRQAGLQAAFATCIEFGDAIFYIEGGSRTDVEGAGWYALLTAIRHTFQMTHGRGLFVMGPVDQDTMRKPEWQGLARSRQQCRVTARPVETVVFRYAPAAAPVARGDRCGRNTPPDRGDRALALSQAG